MILIKGRVLFDTTKPSSCEGDIPHNHEKETKFLSFNLAPEVHY